MLQPQHSLGIDNHAVGAAGAHAAGSGSAPAADPAATAEPATAATNLRVGRHTGDNDQCHDRGRGEQHRTIT